MKEKVLEYLKTQTEGKTPTEIGMSLGKDYNTASSSVSSALKKLTKEGLVERLCNKNRVTYKYKL